jgi:uncharacterized repeat protein (TIGR01451 family)
LLVLLVVGVTQGFAAGPALSLHVSVPDTVTAGIPARLLVVVQNVGNAPFAGPLTFSDAFPEGISPVEPSVSSSAVELPGPTCQTIARTVTCTIQTEHTVKPGEPDERIERILPGGQIYLRMFAPVENNALGTLVNSLEISGAGATQPQSGQESMVVGQAGPFAFKQFAVDLIGSSGEQAEQAASDPAEIETTVRVVSRAVAFLGFFPETIPVEQFKDVLTHVPTGLLGNPTATGVRCSASQLVAPSPEVPSKEIPACPAQSQIGIAQIDESDIVPLYNMVAPYGVPAEFGFVYESVPTILDARLRPGDDGVDIVARDAGSSVPVPGATITLWGVPSDHSHDNLRGACLDNQGGNDGKTCPLANVAGAAFLRLPTSCTGPLSWSADADSFVHPGAFVHATTSSPALSGCERVPFDPSLLLTPSSSTPSSATGLNVSLSLPQEVGPEGLAQGDVHSVTTTLPEGLVLNPSTANGLEVCDDAHLRLGVEGVAECPDGSKIGSLTVTTPLLDHPIEGSVFLRPQGSNDPESGEMFRVAIEVRSDLDGVEVKTPGAVRVNKATGRITTIFDQVPQLPISKLKLRFKDGPRAPLVTPPSCGTDTTAASLSSWSGKTVSSDSSFAISGDGQGAACAPSGFAPGFAAGSSNPIAGVFTPFGLQLTRTDGEARFQELSSVVLPPGLLADIASIPVRCTDAQATAAACPASSRIGSVTAGAGAGPDPFYVTGDVYLTGAYEGDPFGLAIIVHAKAGPFDLGYVVVRSAIRINDDGTVTAQTDPFPQVVEGIVLNLRDVRVNLDRPGFMLNPTSCEPLSITGTATSTLGQTASVSSRFQVGECSRLAFKPKFAVSTGARSSRSMGASLAVNVGMGRGQANIRGVRVRLPRQLPSRNVTLKQACVAGVFEENPAACPSGSLVGTAMARTPILTSVLSGPAYLVSHGGGGFPDLVIVLQGEGVVLHLTGHTNIKSGVTTSTFNALPDAPVSSFRLRLPAGAHSILAAPAGRLCQSRLVVPTTITAQSGVVVSQATRVAVTGCARHKARSRKAG